MDPCVNVMCSSLAKYFLPVTNALAYSAKGLWQQKCL